MCSGIEVRYTDFSSDEDITWHYEDGLRPYLLARNQTEQSIPVDAFCYSQETEEFTVEWAVAGWEMKASA